MKLFLSATLCSVLATLAFDVVNATGFKALRADAQEDAYKVLSRGRFDFSDIERRPITMVSGDEQRTVGISLRNSVHRPECASTLRLLVTQGLPHERLIVYKSDEGTVKPGGVSHVNFPVEPILRAFKENKRNHFSFLVYSSRCRKVYLSSANGDHGYFDVKQVDASHDEFVKQMIERFTRIAPIIKEQMRNHGDLKYDILRLNDGAQLTLQI